MSFQCGTLKVRHRKFPNRKEISHAFFWLLLIAKMLTMTFKMLMYSNLGFLQEASSHFLKSDGEIALYVSIVRQAYWLEHSGHSSRSKTPRIQIARDLCFRLPFIHYTMHLLMVLGSVCSNFITFIRYFCDNCGFAFSFNCDNMS